MRVPKFIKMKKENFIIVLLLSFMMFSCSDSDNTGSEDLDKEVEGLIMLKQIANDDHIIEVYGLNTKIYQGYNELGVRIIDKTTDEIITNASIDWKPVMHMTEMMHSCPKSSLDKITGLKTLFAGYIVFQMPGNSQEGWTLTFDYTIGGQSYMATGNIDVVESSKQVVTVFTGADDVRYVMALMGPTFPDVKINDMTVGLFKMQDMMSFPVVQDYFIELDPRMPSMGNHSSPNNQDLIYDPSFQVYRGKLSLTMTGLWKLNLRLFDANDELVKGELVTEENESSSLYFEIEF